MKHGLFGHPVAALGSSPRAALFPDHAPGLLARITQAQWRSRRPRDRRCTGENAHADHRPVGSAQGRNRFRSSEHAAEDRIHGPQARRAGFRHDVSRPQAGTAAERRRRCDGAHHLHHPQRHASRRALAFRQHDGRRQAGDEVRRDPAGMVLLLGREARLSRQARRLCVQGDRCRTRTRPHRLYAQTARHRAGEHRGRHRLRPAELSRQRLRHGPRGHAFSAQARRARHRHRRLELGRAVFSSPPSAFSRPAIPA